MIIISTLFILACLIIIGAYFLFYFNQIEEVEEPEPLPELDDRISPLTNQGIIFEVNRIRHRGLLDIIMKPGIQWKQKPVFYFNCTIDGIYFNSRDVESANLANDEPFNTWDTQFLDLKLSKDIIEEQPTCDITFQMWEEEKQGLLGLRSKQIPKDKFTVEYDFKTGRWKSWYRCKQPRYYIPLR